VSTLETINKACRGDFLKFYDELEKHRTNMNALFEKINSSDYAIDSFNDKIDSIQVVYESCWENNEKSVEAIRRNIKKLSNDISGDRVVLSTIHSAKGEEAPEVTILQPGKRKIKKGVSPEDKQQENNLRYVSGSRCNQDRNGNMYYVVNRKGDIGDF
jgi:superfamily I DNA/RNA helicase